LCLELGIDDPEKWLANAPERVLRTWWAYWQIEPWGLPWHRHAAYMSLLDAMYAVCLKWFSGGKSKYKPREFRDWMPGDWVTDSQPREKPDSIFDQLDEFRKRVGS